MGGRGKREGGTWEIIEIKRGKGEIGKRGGGIRGFDAEDTDQGIRVWWRCL